MGFLGCNARCFGDNGEQFFANRRKHMDMRKMHSVSYAIRARSHHTSAESTGREDTCDEAHQSPFEKSGRDPPSSRRRTQDAKQQLEEDLLHGAARGDLKRVRRAIGDGAEVNQGNSRGITALMLAASSSGRDALEVLSMLLEERADLAARDANGWLTIHHACRNGRLEATRCLMQRAADPMLVTADGKTCIILAVMESQADLVEWLLKNKAVRDRVTDKDATGAAVLHYAVREGAVNIAKALIDKHARVNARDYEGRQPLMIAAEQNRSDCLKMLCKRNAEIDGIDRSRRTPLMYACLGGNESLAKWLVEKKGADAFHEDIHGDTPMSVADDLGMMALKNMVKQLRFEADDQPS